MDAAFMMNTTSLSVVWRQRLQGAIWGLTCVGTTLSTSIAGAQDAAPSAVSDDAPLAGAVKLRLDAPILLTRTTKGEADGQRVSVSTSSAGVPAGGANLQLGYAVSASANIGLQLAFVESESKVESSADPESAYTAESSQYKVGLYGEHLFIGTGYVHPSLGVFGEILGGKSGQDFSGVGLGGSGAIQMFLGHHASLDFNLRAEWVSVSVGETSTSGFEFGGGLGLALWFGGSEPESPTEAGPPDANDESGGGVPAPVGGTASTSETSEAWADSAVVQLSGATTLTVKGEPDAPTFQLLVRNPEGECSTVEFAIGDHSESIESAEPKKVALGSTEAIVFAGDFPAPLLRRLVRASAETPVRILACGGDYTAGFFAREPLRAFMR